MKFVIFSVILIIAAIMFFVGGETGKAVARGLDIRDEKEAGCAGCLGIVFFIIFGFVLLLKVLLH